MIPGKRQKRFERTSNTYEWVWPQPMARSRRHGVGVCVVRNEPAGGS